MTLFLIDTYRFGINLAVFMLFRYNIANLLGVDHGRNIWRRK